MPFLSHFCFQAMLHQMEMTHFIAYCSLLIAHCLSRHYPEQIPVPAN
jgi:hypothetical protein